MLTTCPNCLHVFHNNNQQHRVVLQPQQHTTPTAPCCETNTQQQQQQPLLVSLTLPPTSVATTCTVSVTTSTCQQHGLSTSQRVLAGMAGGGIVVSNNNNNISPSSVILQQTTTQDEKVVSPQPSPSTPLSFVLPNVFARTFLMPTATNSDTDLVRLAATLKALRTSGWYYEGLSWQESAELLQSTAPGTFLVRDSSDPKFLFSLSVQTERGPTSVRLHYVCGQFRLDAEARLAPLMPLFECVVRLVEYYIEATKNSIADKGSHLRHKEQVWVDARGHMYSHILLTTPLYKKQHLPSLQHLARLTINASLKAHGGPSRTVSASQLPLPTLLTDYLKEYPYSH